MLGSLSIRTRFLISPIIGVILTLVLYFSSDRIIQAHTLLFNNISQANLPQISKISQLSLLLVESNSDIMSLLLESEGLDEEEIYVEGKKQLNKLYKIRDLLYKNIDEQEQLFIDGEDILKKIKTAFEEYITEASSSIEMSSVDSAQANYELVLANKKLKSLNQLFLILSQYYSGELSQQAKLVEGTLYKETYITELAIVLLMIMLWSAFYFSNHTSIGLTEVHNALVKLSKGDTSIESEGDRSNDAYIDNVWRAVQEFKHSIDKNKQYQNDLLIQKFAMDQHAIITTTDREGVITSVNSRFREISGYSADELIGKTHNIINSGHHTQEYWRKMYDTVEQGNVWHDEVLNKAKDGHLYWEDCTIIPMTSVEDKTHVTGYIAIKTDITERKNQFQKLIDANVVAESSVIAKSQFLASMSHEIRTPMNGVIGMLDLVLNENLASEHRKQLEVAFSSAQSLLILINDILDFSKVDAGKLELESIDFNIKGLLLEFNEFMSVQAKQKGLLLHLNLPSFPSEHVIGDPGRIRQILTNVVGNAIKFTESGSVTIDVKLNESINNMWCFDCSITDTGIGIPDKAINSLFESFNQVDASTTRKFGGTGLGLAISKKLVNLMGGEITVTSKERVGSSFQFIIPLNKSKTKPYEPSINSEVTKGLEIPMWPVGIELLLVEDNRVNQLVTQGLLKRFNLTCDIAENGIEAMNTLEQSNKIYDLILMDCQMPEMDGYEATKLIRKSEFTHYANTPIIALTANAMSGDREKCLKSGMSDYLTKPIEPKLLLACLNNWLISDNEISNK